ncbi:MAG: 4-hydroxy-3-methylbut-2-enyl diphosphate reductase [Caldisericia bacterium]
MKIIESNYLGFCSGVNYAYNLVNKTLNKESEIYLLNELVHNKDVNSELKQKGLKIVNEISQIPEGKILIAPAHGISLEDEELAKKKKLKIINATCPLVIRSLVLGKKILKDGKNLIIIGEKNHQEIKYLLSHLRSSKTYLIDKNDDIPKIEGEIGVIIQTTQSFEFYEEMKKRIKLINDNVEFFDTICNESFIRQKEVYEIAKNVDLLIVVGGKNSSNTKRLYEIGSKLVKTYKIENENEIKKEWFNKVKVVGIISGTSTPIKIIQKVKEKCLKLQ